MLQLPNVTLICVATKNENLAIEAIIKSCSNIKYQSVKFLNSLHGSDRTEKIYNINLEFIHIDSFENIDDWNKFIFYDLHKHIDTEFCLLSHPDGYVINSDSWDDRFHDYDYIG